MNLISIIRSANSGLIKDILTGAGLTLGTSAVILTAINTAINTFKTNLLGVSADLLSLAHLAGFDYAFSIVLGAIVARSVQNATKLTIQKIK